MAASASVPNVRRVDGRCRVAGLLDVVLAVAIRAHRRLRDSASHRLPMNAFLVLTGLVAVAHAAGVRHRAAKRLGLGVHQLMRAAVAHGAIRGALIAALALLPVDSQRVIAGLIRVAARALRLGDARRVRGFVISVVARVAGETSVGALCELLPLVMARRAIDRGRVQAGCQQQAEQGGAEPDAYPFLCPVCHRTYSSHWEWKVMHAEVHPKAPLSYWVLTCLDPVGR